MSRLYVASFVVISVVVLSACSGSGSSIQPAVGTVPNTGGAVVSQAGVSATAASPALGQPSAATGTGASAGMAAAWGAAAGYRADAGVPASQRRFGRSFVTGTGANVPLNGSGFPTTLNAFPVTARALPICNQQPTTTSVQCHAAQVPGSSPIGTAQVPVPSLPGLQPATLQRIYLNPQNIPAAGGQNQTVAAVVAYTNPNLESDLNVYRKEFNLPPCTSASGCLKIVQQGSVGTDPQDLWPIESALDAEMISAMCFQCNIMVVEAADATIPNLAAAEDLAVQKGATVVSNSWSIPESPGALAYSSHFSHPGVTITAGAGDGGYGVGFPADLSTVVSVGGTTVQPAGNGKLSYRILAPKKLTARLD